MQNIQQVREKQVGTSLPTRRIEAFSDGVFAIAITILVLQLSIPNIDTNLPDAVITERLIAALVAFWPGTLVSYILSFIIIGVFWVAHHMVFHHIQRSDRGLLWWNMVFLMVVALIPFPTALLGQYFEQRLAVILYAITVTVSGLLLQGLWRYAVHRRRLVDRDLDIQIVREVSRKNMVVPIIYMIAIGMAFINVPLSIGLLILGPAVFLLPSRVSVRSRPPRGSDESPEPNHVGNSIVQ